MNPADDGAEPKGIIADIDVNGDLSSLIVRPRTVQDVSKVMIALQAISGGRVQRTTAGILIPAFQGHILRQAPLPLDLRWSSLAERFTQNRIDSSNSHSDVFEKIMLLKMGGKSKALEYLEDVRESLEGLDDHQVVNVAAMTLKDGCGLCLFDEQGAGKTVSMIIAYDVMVARNEVDFALIIAPKSMIPEWKQDFEKFRTDLYNVKVLVGTRKERIKILRSKADVIVTNFEAAVSLESEIEALFRSKRGRGVIVVVNRL